MSLVKENYHQVNLIRDACTPWRPYIEIAPEMNAKIYEYRVLAKRVPSPEQFYWSKWDTVKPGMAWEKENDVGHCKRRQISRGNQWRSKHGKAYALHAWLTIFPSRPHNNIGLTTSRAQTDNFGSSKGLGGYRHYSGSPLAWPALKINGSFSHILKMGWWMLMMIHNVAPAPPKPNYGFEMMLSNKRWGFMRDGFWLCPLMGSHAVRW